MGDGPNTVSESTVSDAELREFFCPHRVHERELSEFLSACYLCAEANSPSFCPALTEFAAEVSEFPPPKQYSRKQYSAHLLVSDREIYPPPPQIDDQHRKLKTTGGACFAFFLGSDNPHTTPTPPPQKNTTYGTYDL